MKAVGWLHIFLRDKGGLEVLDAGLDNGTNNGRVKVGANMYSTAAKVVRGSIC